jgi:hypothetical protein
MLDPSLPAGLALVIERNGNGPDFGIQVFLGSQNLVYKEVGIHIYGSFLSYPWITRPVFATSVD